MKHEKRAKLRDWKGKFYGKYSNSWGNNEKPLVVWFKEKGLNIMDIRKSKRFWLDMFSTEILAERLIKEYHLFPPQEGH